MKYISTLFTILFLCIPAYADCSVADTKITSMHRYTDGTLFINTENANACGCSQGSRFAMKSAKVDSDSFTVSAALTAFTAGKLVNITGVAGCSIHGNTPELSVLAIHN